MAANSRDGQHAARKAGRRQSPRACLSWVSAGEAGGAGRSCPRAGYVPGAIPRRQNCHFEATPVETHPFSLRSKSTIFHCLQNDERFEPAGSCGLRACPKMSSRCDKLRRFISAKPYSVWSARRSVHCYWNTTLSGAHRRAVQDGLVRLIAAARKRRIFAARGVRKPMILLNQMVSRSRVTA